MRILTVSSFFESHGGGLEIVAGALARALAARGHDSRHAAAALSPTPKDGGVQRIALAAHDPLEAMTGLPMPLPHRAARQELEDEVRAADAVVIHDALYANSQLARRYSQRHRKPWIVIQHIGAIPYRSPALRAALAAANRLVTRPTLRAASQVVFISDTVQCQFADLDFARPPELMFNGVEGALFRPLEQAARRALRQRLGWPEGRPQLLFVGRFVEKKGLAALRALAVLRPDCDIVMVGSGPIDPAGWHLPNLRLPGRKSHRELAELYAAADALVLPSVGEGYPLVVQEAMASGLPVYCGLDSALADPDAAPFLTGIAVDPMAPEATARSFAQAISAVPLPAADEAAAAYARSRYDWDRNAAWIEAKFAALIA
ncbi:MAG: glycosyltransferase [Porphyrobacter sp.]|jgi:glycosyltransferase involved in cell wall biosynthesis|nr:glycosyltransferase [Porphyrobacter sp.]